MENADTEYLMELARRVVEQAESSAADNPSTPEIEVVIVEPRVTPYRKKIPNTLAAMNEIVGGYIENIMIGNRGSGARISIVLNEEGKIFNLPFNRCIMGFDLLVGIFFITAYNLQGDNVSLTDEEINKYIKLFTPYEVYL